jgi:hypothetical protein
MRSLLTALLTALALGLSGCGDGGGKKSTGLSDPDPEPIVTDTVPQQGPIYVLPRDPGSAGRATVAGIDADNDGVRDDVQIYVHITYTDTATRAASRRLVKSLQRLLAAGDDWPLALAAATSMNSAIDCLYSLDPEKFGDYVDAIEGKVVNTEARSRAYAKGGASLSGGIFSVSTVADNAAACREAP